MSARSRCIRPVESDYPSKLRDLAGVFREKREVLPDLYVRGTLPGLPGVAVVGTRHPSQEAVDFTRTLVHALVEAGLCIWSGGALGIDGAAHEAALEAGGATVVVMGGGLSQWYPPQHKGLFERVLRRSEAGMGALVARLPDGAPPLPYGFCKRNEVLAAGTEATVVIQAGYKSGARNTAAAARRLGRPLFAVPYAPWDAKGQGCAVELALGAKAITCATDLLSVLAANGHALRVPERTLPEPRNVQLSLSEVKANASKDAGKSSPACERDARAALSVQDESPPALQIPKECEAFFSVLTENPQHLDEICEKIHERAPLVLEGLLTLTLLAVVVEEPAGFYRRRAGLGDTGSKSKSLLEQEARSPPTVSNREQRD